MKSMKVAAIRSEHIFVSNIAWHFFGIKNMDLSLKSKNNANIEAKQLLFIKIAELSR